MTLLLALAAGLFSSGQAEVSGKVTYVTPVRAYVDKGSDSGLSQGVKLTLLRHRHNIGTCVVDLVAPNSAACKISGTESGDTFKASLEQAQPSASLRQPVELPPLLSSREQAEGQHALSQAAYGKVDAGAPARKEPLRLETATVTLEHGAWAMAASDKTFQRERAAVVINGAPLPLLGLRAYADLEAWWWSQGDARGRDAIFYAREAQLSRRNPGASLTFALGRVRPWLVPGVVMFDGAQLGWRAHNGLELGVFGGGIPDAHNLEPTFDRWQAGLYGAYLVFGDKDDWLHVLRTEARASVRTLPDEGTISELEASASAWLSRGITTAFGARIASGGGASFSLDTLRLQLGAQPFEGLRLAATARYLDPTRLEDGLQLLSNTAAGGWLTQADVAYSPTLGINVSMAGGAAQSAGRVVNRSFFGPEISAPRLFGRAGGMAVGHREEFGWTGGRTSYLQLTFASGDSWQLLTRLSYFEQRTGGITAIPTGRDVGTYVHTSWSLMSHLSLTASVLARGGLPSGERSKVPVGFVAKAGIEGTL